MRRERRFDEPQQRFELMATKYGETVLRKSGERPADLRRIRRHSVGRQRFGTHPVDWTSDDIVMQWMGIED
jgi:hypothetical protein